MLSTSRRGSTLAVIGLLLLFACGVVDAADVNTESSLDEEMTKNNDDSKDATVVATTSTKRRTILVTGAAGFVGSHVADFLLGRGDNVVVVDEVNDYYDVSIKEGNLQLLQDKYGSTANAAGMESSGSSSNGTFVLTEGPRLSIYRGDICNETFLDDVFAAERFDAVCHMAARAGVRPSIEDPFVYVHSNILGTVRLMERAVDQKISNFVFASSSSVYGGSKSTYFSELERVDRPISPYAATKKTAELLGYVYSHVYDLPVTALRFFTVYGPRGRPDMAPFKFIDRVSRGTTIQQFGDGTSSRDYTYIDDIVQGVVRALDTPAPYSILNLGKGSGTVLKEFLDLVEKYVGRSAVIEVLPDQPGDVPYTCANVTLAKNQLGYEPTVPFDQGIERTVQWYQTAYPTTVLEDVPEDVPKDHRHADTPVKVAKDRSRKHKQRRHRRWLHQQANEDPDRVSRAILRSLRLPSSDDAAVPQLSIDDMEDELLEQLLQLRTPVHTPRRVRRMMESDPSSLIALPHTGPKTVLVTGGAGFVGSHLVDRLLQRGDRVVLVDLPSATDDGALDWLRDAHANNDKLVVYSGDACDGAFMGDVFAKENPEWVCHLASQTTVEASLGNPVDHIHSNIESTLRLLELSRGSEYGGYDIQNFVLASSDAVYGTQKNRTTDADDSRIYVRSEDDRVDYPKTPYGATKKSAELLAFTYHHLYKIPVSALRLFQVYGPRYRSDTEAFQLMDHVLSGDDLKQSPVTADSSSDYTYVEDVVDGIVRSLDRPYGYEIINLGGGNCEDSAQEFVLLAAEASGRSVALADQVHPAHGVDGVSCADVSKAERLLDYKPSVSFKEGVQRTVAWHQAVFFPDLSLPSPSGGSSQGADTHLNLIEGFEHDDDNDYGSDEYDDDDDDTESETTSNDDMLQASLLDLSDPTTETWDRFPVASSLHAISIKVPREENYVSSFPAWLRRLAFVQWLLVVLILVVRAYYKGNINPFGRPHDEATTA